MTLDVMSAAQQFLFEGRFKSAEPFGTIHINDTFLVTFERNGTKHHYIL